MYSKLVALSLAVLFLAPALGYAQEDLRATIELAVLSDPRSQTLSQEEIAALVDALYDDAVAQGVTAEDITWRPVPPEDLEASTAECGMLCSMTQAFGFDGSNLIIPIMLGVSSLLLIFMLAAFLGYRHFHHLHPKPAPSVGPSPMPSAPVTSAPTPAPQGPLPPVV